MIVLWQCDLFSRCINPNSWIFMYLFSEQHSCGHEMEVCVSVALDNVTAGLRPSLPTEYSQPPAVLWSESD